MDIQIKSISPADFPRYRTDVMFDGYKWDMQSGEQSTISDKVVLLGQTHATYLQQAAVKLYHETITMEAAIKKQPQKAIDMGISPAMAAALCGAHYDPAGHIRFMRFDFHWTVDRGKLGFGKKQGWKISEVNSDVPAGYPEASVLPRLAEKYFPGYRACGDFGKVFATEMKKLASPGGTIAYISDSHIVEDYQIMHFLGDIMEGEGYKSLYTSPELLDFSQIGGIVRYFPVEWLETGKGVAWQDYVSTAIPSCNPHQALLTQSKRLPLVWDSLGVPIPTWQALLPTTKPPTYGTRRGYILKPAFGRVGEGINLPGTVTPEENQAIIHAATTQPNQWVAQKIFTSQPVGGYHLNVGVFAMNGQYAGMYGRISTSPRTDEDASEVPILIPHTHKGDIYA